MSKNEASNIFHWADYLVFALSLLVSAVIGIYYGIKSFQTGATAADFLVGGHKLRILPVALSLHASFMSAIFVLGSPAEIYLNGSMYAYIGLGYLLAAPITAHFFLPVFYKMNATSCYEFLERRFSRHIRSLGSLVFVFMMLLYMAIVLYTPALAFSQVTGLSMLISVVGIGLVCTFYTAIGGIKAVVWTDAFQMIVILAGLIALLVRGTISVGGWQRVMDIVYEGQRVQPPVWSLDPYERHTIWTQFIGGGLMTLTLYGVNQAMVQRYISVGSMRNAQLTVYMAMTSSAIYLSVITLLGFVLYAYYHDCDPLSTNKVAKPDQLIPYMVMDVLGTLPGLPGLFTAATFSAALSTVSSGVNSLAAVLLEDHYKPLYVLVKRKPVSDACASHITRISAVLLGLSTIGLAMLTSLLGPLVLQITLSLFGIIGGPLLGLFCLGLFFPCANSWGAAAGVVTSVTITMWLKLGAIVNAVASSTPLPVSTNCTSLHHHQYVHHSDNSDYMYTTTATAATSDWPTGLETEVTDVYTVQPALGLYKISYMWYTPLALCITLCVGVLVSVITNRCRSHRVFSALCLVGTCTHSADGCCLYTMAYTPPKQDYKNGHTGTQKKQDLSSCESVPLHSSNV